MTSPLGSAAAPTVAETEVLVLGGGCLNVGCIPSKALLHVAKVITDAQAMARHGIRFVAPEIDLRALRTYKDEIVGKLTRGLAGLARQRKVGVIQGTATFDSPHSVVVRNDKGERKIRFAHCIIAAGSSPAQ